MGCWPIERVFCVYHWKDPRPKNTASGRSSEGPQESHLPAQRDPTCCTVKYGNYAHVVFIASVFFCTRACLFSRFKMFSVFKVFMKHHWSSLSRFPPFIFVFSLCDGVWGHWFEFQLIKQPHFVLIFFNSARKCARFFYVSPSHKSSHFWSKFGYHRNIGQNRNLLRFSKLVAHVIGSSRCVFKSRLY